MYIIVDFVKSNEIDFIPCAWMVDEAMQSEVSKLLQSKQLVQMYWPPMKAPANVFRAKDQCMSAEDGWPTYTARILGTASEYINYHYCR